MSLHDYVSASAKRFPSRMAVVDREEAVTYAALDARADRVAQELSGLGVVSGDRVGLWLEKSVGCVVLMQAVLRLGAAYVPLDPLDNTERIRVIVSNCQLKVLVTSQARRASIESHEWPTRISSLGEDVYADEVRNLSEGPQVLPTEENSVGSDCLAYILYTSGSTGTPKGVCISHGNATAFVGWAAETLGLVEDDRLANHAPFHFDLSVFDLYAAFAVGASVFLIAETDAYLPGKLVAFLKEREITTWYSVPSILLMMMEEPGFPAGDEIALRNLIYAGEPFPIRELRRLFELWHSQVRFFNFYGPTETNVCTYHEVTAPDLDRDEIPIGRAASGDQVWAVCENERLLEPDGEGVLMVAGPTVMLGYWGEEAQGKAAYCTGDRVRQLPAGEFVYVGRQDDMVKVRGVRIELGEIEAILQRHSAVHEVLVAIYRRDSDVRIVAFVVAKDTPPTLLELKRFCAKFLPRQMVVDDLELCQSIPLNRSGKRDRRQLVARFEDDARTVEAVS